MKLLQLENDSQLNNILPNYSKIILQLSADWCNPCVRVTPSVQEYVSTINMDDCVYVYCDVDKCPEIYSYMKVKTIPCFIVLEKNISKNEFDISKISTSDINEIVHFFNSMNIRNVEHNEPI